MTSDLERVCQEGYLGDVEARSIEDIRIMRAECQEVETGLSYLRRLIQGRLDLVGTEARRRERGEGSSDIAALVANLPEILSSDRTRPDGFGRLPQTVSTGSVDETLAAEVDAVLGPRQTSAMAELSDEALAAAAASLAAIERKVAEHRQQLFDRLDALQHEIGRRYRTGEITADATLH